ncbi:hypothetical protein MtrunA17_Chr2g0278301 [Medicago truncatula]|uniref:Uncharacterized protein n=1 Tax=Medicago truncatula TaxID=3880 RepID=A0A396J2G8_MEDTR|nr:hypothetical protein MtrunA17_Chr2g0278301 [Medicago truncatula]
MNYLDPTNKLLIFISWWVNYPPFFKGNLKKTKKKKTRDVFLSFTFYLPPSHFSGNHSLSTTQTQILTFFTFNFSDFSSFCVFLLDIEKILK